MKFSMPVKNLLVLTSRAVGVVDNRPTVQVLASLLLEASGDTVKVRATDLYQSLSAVEGAKVYESGSTCVPAKDIVERIKNIPAGDVIVSTADNGTVEIKAASSPRRYRVHGLPGDSFPEAPPMADGVTAEIPSAEFLNAIDRVFRFISLDETRPHLNSLSLQATGTRMRLAATDGHRVGLAHMDLVCDPFEVLVSQKATAQLRKLLAAEGSVRISIQGPNICFGFSWGEFTAKLVEATYPDVSAVCPAKTESAAMVPRVVMIEAVRAVNVASNDRTGGVKLRLEAGTMFIEASSAERGDGADEIAIQYDGPPMTIGLNAKYILDALEVIGTEEAHFGFSAELDPTIWHAVNDRDSGLVVTMPMRL